MRVILGLVALVLLVACVPTDPGSETSAGSAVEIDRSEPTATLVTGDTTQAIGNVTTTGTQNDGTLEWNSDGSAVILRFEQIGGMLASAWGTEIPQWTLYGDGLLVWTQEGTPTPGFAQQVWTGHLDQVEIDELIIFIQQAGFLDLGADYQAPQFVEVETDESTSPILAPNLTGGLDQPTGIITLNLLNRQHRVQVYPAAWTEAPEAYQTVQARIMATRPDDAAQFVPTTLQLSSSPLSPGVAAPSPDWPLPDISLTDTSTTLMQLDTSQGVAVTEFLTSQGVFATELGKPYRLNLLAAPPRSP